MTKETKVQKLRKIIIVIFVFIIFGYGILTARDAIFGVNIKLDNIKKTTLVSKDPLYKISGYVNHAEELLLNGLPLSINEKGVFTEVVVLSPGYNKIALVAKNKFKKTHEVDLEIVLE